MKIARSFLLYMFIVGALVGVTWYIMETGNGVHAGALSGSSMVPESPNNQPVKTLGVLLLQIIVILSVARIFAMLAARFGQQRVIGEIIAGIFLGPSVLGYFWPESTALLFPATSIPNLQALSQFGLIFFMFIIGIELDLGKLKFHSRDALLISHTSISWSFLLGVLLAYNIYTAYAPAGVPFFAFALFMGISLSITAFPVLARILRERGLSDTPLGTLVITCAAIDDLSAWCILAAIIVLVKAGSLAGAMTTFVLAAIYVVFMLFVVRTQINKWMLRFWAPEKDSRVFVSGAFLVLLISAYLAESIGIHALFGAFTAGVVLSEQTEFKIALREKLEDISVLVLLPVFFACTGLRTQIGLLDSNALWSLAGVIVLLAILGKFGGGTLAARLAGRPWQESLSVGVLMNTRGLMELVVLNIGYDLGILSPQLFAILVLMALATTFMTGPWLSLINWLFSQKKREQASYP